MKSRQFELLIYLMKYRKSTYGELAAHFAVSKKTIERDLNQLSLMGIPVYCVQGAGGGVYLDEKYQFSGSFFTPKEIHQIIMALSITDTFSLTPQKATIIQKLCLLDSSLTTLVENDIQQYLTIDLIDVPIDTDTPVCHIINHCLEAEVLATIDGIESVACLEYVLKRDGLYLFAFAAAYLLLKITDIRVIEPTKIEFERDFISYTDFKKKNN
ncbi:MAG: helix-turn-helix transcriptional regulator [Culicoidibacterales bacterium]